VTEAWERGLLRPGVADVRLLDWSSKQPSHLAALAAALNGAARDGLLAVVCEHRNWIEGNDGPLKSATPPPLPLSLLTVIIGLLAQDGDAIYFAPRLLEGFIENGQVDARVVQRAARTLLQSPAVSPAKLARALEKEIGLLPVLWPLLTESVKAAGERVASGDKPPVWANRVLGTALRYAPYLAEAARQGFIPTEDAQWAGLSEIAASTAKSASVTKARNLLWLSE
jgi:hypothetical protein